MTEMESALVRALNSFFMTNEISAFAYRQYQSKFGRGQVEIFFVTAQTKDSIS
jgi:hypothetical protein